MNPKFAVRDVEVGDVSFIYATWLRALYYGNDMFNRMPKSSFFPQYKAVLGMLLPLCTIKICCLEDEPDVILGYSVFLGTTLHWVYVKKSWRRLGVANSLIPSNITRFSHITKLGEKARPPEWVFDPFALN